MTKELSTDTFGDRLRYCIKKRYTQQKDFATQLHIAESTLSNYVNNRKEPDIQTVIIICKKLAISSDWLLGITKT